MAFFASKPDAQTEQRLVELNKKISGSFILVKQDTELLFKWIDYLYKIIQNQQQTLDVLNQKINSINTIKPEDIKRMIDLYYAHPLNNVVEHIKLIERKVDDFEKQKVSHVQIEQQRAVQVAAVQSAVQSVEQDKKLLLKNKFLKNFAKKSKDYIKNVLFSLIQKYGTISALQLREMVVEEQSLCSKSSFYRLLEELERDDEVVVGHKGKEKIYSPKFEKAPKHQLISRR